MFSIIIGLSLALSSIIETSSWAIRSYSIKNNKGLFIARTNIYLYGGRFFLLLFATGLSFLVDTNASARDISLVISASYLVAALVHFVLIKNETKIFLDKRILAFLKLSYVDLNSKNVFHLKLFIFSLISAAFFCCAMIAPYTLETQFPEYRITVSGLSQFINSLGTIILLFTVDPILYNLLDKNKLSASISSYTIGRLIGYLIGSFIAFIPYLLFE